LSAFLELADCPTLFFTSRKVKVKAVANTGKLMTWADFKKKWSRYSGKETTSFRAIGEAGLSSEAMSLLTVFLELERATSNAIKKTHAAR